MKDFAKRFAKVYAKVAGALYLIQIGFGMGVGLFFGYYMAANFSPEEVQRIISCVGEI